MNEKVPLSVVILTKNDEGRIARTLESVTWAGEIIVVDDESRDATRQIASRYTDRVFVRKMDIEGVHRNWAYAKASHQWVLSLDSDEVVTPELKAEITAVLQGDLAENGFTIPRRNYIGEYWVRHGGWYPSPQLRLFRKDKFRYEEVAVHPRAFMDDPCGHLHSDMVHYSYRNFEDFWAKLNNQTTREAQKWFDQRKPMRLARFLWRTYDRFMRSYVGRHGYRDGFIGFIVAFNAGLYQFMSYLKYREMCRQAESRDAKVRAVFLDRDGVINEYPGDLRYVTSAAEFRLLPGAIEALVKIRERGFKLYVISNQAGVSKGVYPRAALDSITEGMLSAMRSGGVSIDKVFYCTHREEDNCSCRKPKTGLIEEAALEIRRTGAELERQSSFIVGDTLRDIETGKNAGLKTILVFSGKEKPSRAAQWHTVPDYTAADLLEAAEKCIF